MVTGLTQLTIDGREVPYPIPRPRPLSAAQRDIMRWARANGSIRSSEAGVAVHVHRAERGYYCGRPYKMKELGCCEWAASDGYAACRRLAARGLLRRVHRGLWVPA